MHIFLLEGSAHDSARHHTLRRPVRALASAWLPRVRQCRVQRHDQDQGRHEVVSRQTFDRE